MNADETISAFLKTLANVVCKSEKLPSGVVWFSVWKGSEFFTIECTKEGQIGISKVQDNEGFVGHDESFTNAQNAVKYLALALSGTHQP